MTKKYPLEPLSELRAQKVEDAARELAAKVAAREQAARRRADAERAAAAHEQAVAAARAEARAALERGELRAADLAREGAWDVRVREERAELERRIRDARAAETAAEGAEASARRAVAAREADAKVVERHRDRHDARERASVLAAEEEDADDAFSGQKRAR
jgi:hypothetical protein